jgi:transcriptional regulator with XRE-family HTH domain
MYPVPPEALQLARRLRQLRQEQWPDARLTQATLARAFSSEGSLAAATVSSWESLSSPRLPPRRRLLAYARFFATQRSVEPSPHLLQLDELTQDEKTAFMRLETELLTLRKAVIGDLPEESEEERGLVAGLPAMPFGMRLRQLRHSAGLTQEELAEAARLSSRTISDLERGVSPTARQDTVRLLADALGLTGAVREEFETSARGRDAASGAWSAGIAAATRTLPRDIATFTGREAELRHLLEVTAASASGGPAGIYAIGGMAGVGKTSLAIHAAHLLAPQFPDGQIFLPLHGHTPGQQPVEPTEALISLLHIEGVPAHQIPADLEARTAQWRDRTAGRRLLLVLDDAASSEQVRTLLPGVGGSLVLVTSRRYLTALDAVTSISLDTLMPEEAAELLVRLAARPGLDPADAAVGELTSMCGYLPLAIGIIARQLHNHPAWSAADRAAELAAARNRLELMVSENLSISAAFDLSYRELTDGQQRMFRRLGMHPGTDIEVQEAAALDGTDLTTARRNLDALYDRYLLAEPVRGRYRMHDLLRDYARALTTGDDPGAGVAQDIADQPGQGAGQGTFAVERFDPFVTPLGLIDTSAGHSLDDETDTSVYATEVSAAGRTPDVSPPQVEIQPADGVVARELRIPAGIQVISWNHRRFIDGMPWSLQTTFFPLALAQQGADRLTQAKHVSIGLNRYIAETLGLRQVGWRDRIAVRSPNVTEAAFFQLPDDGAVPVFEIQRTACDQTGTPIRLTVTVYPADRNSFVLSPYRFKARTPARMSGLQGANGPDRDPAEDGLAGSRSERADQAESEARRALAQRAFDEAIEFLREAVALDPGRAERLQPDLDCLSGRPGDSAGRRAWRRGLWLALAAGSPLELHNAKPVTVAPPVMPQPDVMTPTISELTPDPRVPVRPEEGGAALEVAFIRLLERFFSLAADDKEMILDRLRRQSSGTQYGHDVQFDCTVASDNVVRCHVECKNYSRQLQLADVADKILQTQAYWHAKKIDYFVIVTPRAGTSNDLDHFIQTWNAVDSSPFRIQVWGPEQRIKEFFALEPSAYQAVYGTGSSPSPDVAAVVARWAGRLAPVLRLPPSLSGYLDTPSRHCLPGEDHAHFDGLFDDCIEVDTVDPAGSPLGRLSDVLARWLDAPERQPFLLLGEFGDGKSFACYRLTRLLARRYRQNPAAVPFPVRLALRDLVAAGNPQELLSRRLQALGSDIQDWARLQVLGPTLVVLDGFDEMSAQLDHATVVRNLRLLADCVRYFSASKLLVTSRTHYFETSRMQRRFFEQLGEPSVARLAPLPLSERIEHLQAYAEQHDLSGKFERIRRLYDPIGLAGKPLFLQMIKETLPTLPDEDFDELVLYDASVRDSLERKAEMLEDKDMLTLQKEAIEGMVELLEALAVKLLHTGGQAVDLRTFGADHLDIARVLWKMSEADAGTEQAQDARARLGVRSLLKPSPQADQPEAWSVTFCHRSMAEYFVARALARALRHDRPAARDLLSSVILGPEIIDFTALSVNKDDRVADLARTLAGLARSAALGASHGYLGGNAITLAYRGRRKPTGHRWAGLDLGYADLSGTDLSGADFAGSSLRFATLDNADLSGADLTGCDLTGVRLEETAPVICVAPGRTQGSVLACYGDGTIREWLPRGSRLVPQKLLDGLANLKSAAWGPYGDLVVVDGRGLSIWEIAADEAARQDAFPIRGGTDDIRFAAGAVSFARTDVHQHVAALVNCEAAEVDAAVALTHDGPVAFAGNQAVTMPVAANAIGFARLNQPDRTPLRLPVTNVTAVDVHREEGDAARLLLADGEGHVTSLRVAPDGEAPELSTLATRRLHDGPVLSAAFLSADLVATGGMDRSLAICEWDRNQLRTLHQLKLTLRCVGVRTSGVRGEHERRLLEALRARAEADSDASGASNG